MYDTICGEYQCIPLRRGMLGQKEDVFLADVRIQNFRRPNGFIGYRCIVKSGDRSSGEIISGEILATIPFPTDAEKEVLGESPNGAICPIKLEAYTNHEGLDLYVTLQDGTAEYRLQTVADPISDDLPGIILEGLWHINIDVQLPESSSPPDSRA